MSSVTAVPELLTAAAADVAGVGSSLNAANAAATAQTTAVIAAAQDEVSAAVASLFSGHGQAFQAASAKAAAFHNDFVNLLRGGAGAYLHTEVANASALSHQLGITHSGTAPGSAATGDATLGPGVYYGGEYADGRVIVTPGSSLGIGQGCSLNVAPGSVVFVGSTYNQPGYLNLRSNTTLNVGPHSGIFISGGTLDTVTSNSNFTMGPDAVLSINNKSDFFTYAPVTIDHSEVLVTNNTVFSNYKGDLTISHGHITGPYTVSDKLRPGGPLKWFETLRDLVVITNFPPDGTPSVRLR